MQGKPQERQGQQQEKQGKLQKKQGKQQEQQGKQQVEHGKPYDKSIVVFPYVQGVFVMPEAMVLILT